MERGREREKSLEFEQKKQVTAHTIGPTPAHRPWRNAELSEKHALVDCMGGSQSVGEPVIRVPMAAGKSFDTRLPDRPVICGDPWVYLLGCHSHNGLKDVERPVPVDIVTGRFSTSPSRFLRRYTSRLV
ncbi:KR domain-containing protein [Aspergillus luchuensis]|uniref:KR domain-containing protein n=1 Tax=Aspergillus kawachii TaxID=1069201 RepID=A0A146FB53_ASPKA|nr:KR domain-containing protein [Aspergillus luchuensis]